MNLKPFKKSITTSLKKQIKEVNFISINILETNRFRNMNSDNIYEGQKQLVLARLNTLNPNLKIMGSRDTVSVEGLIEHVEKDDDFGKNIVRAQMTMLKVLAKTTI